MRLPLVMAAVLAAVAAHAASAQSTTIRFVSASPSSRAAMLQKIGSYQVDARTISKEAEEEPQAPMPPLLDDFLKADGNSGGCPAHDGCCARPTCCAASRCCAAPSRCAAPSCCSKSRCRKCGPRFPILAAMFSRKCCASSCCAKSASYGCAAPSCAAPSCAAPSCAAPSCAAASGCGCAAKCWASHCCKCRSWRPGQFVFGVLDMVTTSPFRCRKASCCASAGCHAPACHQHACACHHHACAACGAGFHGSYGNDEVPEPPVPPGDTAVWSGRYSRLL